MSEGNDASGADLLAPGPTDRVDDSPVTVAAADAGQALGLSLRTSVIGLVVNSVSGIELARSLGLSGRGSLAAAMLWPIVAGNLGTLGIEESMTYHVAREPGAVRRWLGSGLVLWGLQSVGFGLLTAAIIPLVLSGKPTSVVVSALIFCLYIPLFLISIMLNAVLNGLHRYRWFNFIRLLIGLLIIVSQTVLLVTDTISVRTVVIAWVLCHLMMTLCVVWLVRRAGVKELQWDRSTVRRLFSYGIRSHASAVPAGLNQNLDQLLISIFLTTRQLGLYVIAVTMSSVTAVVGYSVAYATLPNVARLPDGPERAALARKLVSLTMLISAAISVPVLILAPFLIRLFYGPAFVGASDVGRILLVAAVALSTNRSLEAVLRGVGRPLDAGISELVALGATAIGLAALLPTLGIVGAGLASVIAYLVAMAYMTTRATRSLNVSPVQLLVPDRAAIDDVLSRARALLAR